MAETLVGQLLAEADDLDELAVVLTKGKSQRADAAFLIRKAANTIEALEGALRKARPIVAGAAMITASAAEKRAPGAAEIAAEDAALLVEIDAALALTSTDKPEDER